MADLDVTVVRAAAGCGKTTDLARRYLGYLKAGFGVQETIAITFTRRAAAELQERVSLALRAAGQGPAAEKARGRLGGSWKLYETAAPRDPEVLATALEQIPDAPIGTTDGFIQRLLTEFALDTALPIPDGDAVLLDVPIAPGEGLTRALDRAARRVLDPPDGGVDPRVEELLSHLSLDEIRAGITRRSPYDDLRPAPATEILLDLAEDIARICLRHDLVAMFGPSDPTATEDWVDAITPRTNIAGKWAIPAVAHWLASSAPLDDAPFELIGWLVGLNLQSQARKNLQRDLQTTERDLGMGRLSLWDIVMALQYPFDAEGHVQLADRIRDVLHELRQEVIGDGLRHAARSGELGHDELLESAVALCRSPPPRLRNRFRALLVDEVQDANPGQLRLYRALAALPGDHPISAYFVGDVRQSIYLFRNAEPQGLLEFERDSLKSGRKPIELGTNFRSAPQLVQAQRDLFAAIDEPMRIRRWNPPPSLENLKYHEGNASLHLDPDVHKPPDPVWLVHGSDVDVVEADRRALFTFLSRVRACWECESGAESDTAVVLTATWRQAQEACRQLRRWAGRDDIAFVDGGSGWTASRVGTDVALLLRALRDPTDDVAWLGVWKHPAIGLTDGALARIRAGEGLVAYGPEGPEPASDRCRVLGWSIDADALGPPHDTVDRGVFARVRNPLRHARDTLGRRGTAELLDSFVTELHWRTVLSAGPGADDDVAQLEVILPTYPDEEHLEWVRRQDQEGVPPELVIERLQDPRSELPHVHLSRSGQHVLCTTTFQSKGLAWDHVCCLGLGRVAGAVRGHEPAWMSSNGRRVRLEGVHFDPYGGITPFLDPLGRLAQRLHQHRQGEESARLAYVALTRARRTVTVGLPTKGKAR
ncbi:MAG: UvrD-helicase domain-containing protein, partial [Myxococcota bacterium]